MVAEQYRTITTRTTSIGLEVSRLSWVEVQSESVDKADNSDFPHELRLKVTFHQKGDSQEPLLSMEGISRTNWFPFPDREQHAIRDGLSRTITDGLNREGSINISAYL